MMKCFGMQNVWIMNGTFQRWAKEGRKIESGDSESALRRMRSDKEQPGDFDFKFDHSRIRNFEEMDRLVKENQNGKQTNPPMLDGRLSKFFDKAHIPTTKSVPFDAIMDADYNFLPKDKLAEIYKKLGGV